MRSFGKIPRSLMSPVLVLGATDGLGIGLVEAVLEAGLPVLGVDNDAARLDALRERFTDRGTISTLPGSVTCDESAAALASALRELPQVPLATIVNLHVSCVRGRLLDKDGDFLERRLKEEVLPHMHAARHLLPLLAERGRCARYLVMGGPNADTSWLGYGHHSVAAAATRMLVQVLHREASGTPARVQQLVVGKPVRTEDNAHCACPEWPDALSVGRYAVKVLSSTDSADAIVRFDPASSEAHVDIGSSQTITR